jgi:hypothetical protein
MRCTDSKTDAKGSYNPVLMPKFPLVAGLTEENDKPRWKSKPGKFSIKSMYNQLSRCGIDCRFKYLWEAIKKGLIVANLA